MKIQILGSGCAKCEQLAANAKMAVTEFGIPAEVEKITDIRRISEMGVLMTPALAVDGRLKSVGKVLSAEEIARLVKAE